MNALTRKLGRVWKNIVRFFYCRKKRIEGEYLIKERRICHIWLKPRRYFIGEMPTRNFMQKELHILKDESIRLKRQSVKILRQAEELTDGIHFARFRVDYRRPVEAEAHFQRHLSLYVSPPASIGYACNLGDHVQAICLGRQIRRMCPEIAVLPVFRDELSLYQGEPAFCVMQGWFARGCHYFPNGRIWPVFIAFHLVEHQRKRFIEFLRYNPRYLEHRSIGCRDRQTAQFFSSMGMDAYFSRCFTLTLPRRQQNEAQRKVFIVDVRAEYLDYIPEDLRSNAELIAQRCLRETERGEGYYMSPQWREEQDSKAWALLERYRDEAALVITCAVHCASPCTAMGIPVVMLALNEHEARVRSDFLEGIIPVYSADELKQGLVDWNPCAPDIEELKELMCENLRQTLECERHHGGEPSEELRYLRERIASFRVIAR